MLANWINNKASPVSSATSIPVECPADGSVIAQCPISSAAEVDLAVKSAKIAYETWSYASILPSIQIYHFKKPYSQGQSADLD